MIFETCLESDRIRMKFVTSSSNRINKIILNCNSPSLEEASKKLSMRALSELAYSQSVKADESEVITRGFTAGEPHSS